MGRRPGPVGVRAAPGGRHAMPDPVTVLPPAWRLVRVAVAVLVLAGWRLLA